MHDRNVYPKVILASVVGSSIEWFDYFLYGTMSSLIISKLFFTNYDAFTATLLAYLSFALTFFIRPLGGVFFAHIGDKVGRKKTLVATLMLMGGATVAIGLLPTYAQIGAWAPVLLLTLRIVQGLGIGGEWGGALLLAYEYAPEGKRSFFVSFPQAGVTIGMLLSTLAVAFVSLLAEADFIRWGWRIPFLASGALVFLGLWIRNGIEETPAFRDARQSESSPRVPLLDLLRHHRGALLMTIGAKVVETAPFYIFTTFSIGYATQQLGLEREAALLAVSLGAVVATIAIPLYGMVADHIGKEKLFLIGCLATIAVAIPYFTLLDRRSNGALFVAAVLTMGLVWPMLTSSLGSVFADAFPVHARYTGVTLGYQLGAALAGGTAPLIATTLLALNEDRWMPVAFYMMGCALISLVAVWVGARHGRRAHPSTPVSLQEGA